MYSSYGDFVRGMKWPVLLGAVLWTLIILGISSAFGQSISGSALKGQSDINITIPQITVPVQDLMWRELAISTRGPTLFMAYTYTPTMGFEWESKVSDKTKIIGIDFDKDKIGLFDFRLTGQRFELGYLAGHFAPVVVAEQWGTSFTAQGEKDRRELSGRNWTLGGGCRASYPLGRDLWLRGNLVVTRGSATKTSTTELLLTFSLKPSIAFQVGYGFRHFRTALDPIAIEIRSHGPMAGTEVRW